LTRATKKTFPKSSFLGQPEAVLIVIPKRFFSID